MTYKVFQNNTALTVEDLNDVLMEQAVITFADATARDNAIPAPNPGMHCHLLSTKKTYFYHSTKGWVELFGAWAGDFKQEVITALGSSQLPADVPGAPGKMLWSSNTKTLYVHDGTAWQKVIYDNDSQRRYAGFTLSANYVTAATGDITLPRNIWTGTPASLAMISPINTADTAAIGLPSKGVWQVTWQARGSTTGTGERYTAIVKATDHNIRYAAENNIGTSTFTQNMTAYVETDVPMDLHLTTFSAAGAITLLNAFSETRLTVSKLLGY